MNKIRQYNSEIIFIYYFIQWTNWRHLFTIYPCHLKFHSKGGRVPSCAYFFALDIFPSCLLLDLFIFPQKNRSYFLIPSNSLALPAHSSIHRFRFHYPQSLFPLFCIQLALFLSFFSSLQNSVKVIYPLFTSATLFLTPPIVFSNATLTLALVLP